MIRIEFSRRSVSDIDTIFDYISLDNPGAAIAFKDRLIEKCQSLGTFPNRGTPRDELMPGLRVLCEGSYVIYYSVQPNLIKIVRVLHGARDKDAFVFDDLN